MPKTTSPVRLREATRRGPLAIEHRAFWVGLALALAALVIFAGQALAAVFSNPAPITMPQQGGEAMPYPATIEVSGRLGTITDLNVTLDGLTHASSDDVAVQLVGPGGQGVILMSGAGDTTGVTGARLTLDDEAARQLPDSGQLSSGTYRPANHKGVVAMPPEQGPFGSNLSVFDGTDPNGTYKLYVLDDREGDSGKIARGFSLDIKDGGALNNVPTADGDSYVAKEDKPLTVKKPGVLKNDSDPDGDRLTAKLVSDPRKGKLALKADGSFTYDPKKNFNGTDTFTYRACDTEGACSVPVRATISVKPVKG